MRILADTSFLVASLVQQHPHHERAMPWVVKILKKQIQIGVCSHSIAELYSILTRLPISPRIPPAVALKMITENILEKAEVIDLRTADYVKCVSRATERGLHGGVIYDFLIGMAFEKFKGQGILTFNHKDFVRLFPENPKCVIVP